MERPIRILARRVPCRLAAMFLLVSAGAPLCQAAPAAKVSATFGGVASQYCVACHGTSTQTAGLDLEFLNSTDLAEHSESWEKVVKKLRGRQMPPMGLPKPDDAVYRALVEELSGALDDAASQAPEPGRTDTFRRLNRTEYRNAIRDLLAVDVQVDSLLPSDSASHGFDNITVGDLPPMLLERYVSAAEKISRVAVGRPGRLPDAETIRVPPDLTQEGHIPGLPIGTRGGVLVPYTFPVDGEYELSVRLARDRNEDIEGLTRPHQMELLVDRTRLTLFDVKPPPKGDDERNADSHLIARASVKAGQHEIAATFLKDALGANRDPAPAVPSSFQLLSASAYAACCFLAHDHRSALFHRTRCYCKPRADLRLPTRNGRCGRAMCRRDRAQPSSESVPATG